MGGRQRNRIFGLEHSICPQHRVVFNMEVPIDCVTYVCVCRTLVSFLGRRTCLCLYVIPLNEGTIDADGCGKEATRVTC